ncbi:MAG: hypothetical protein LBS36_02095 [Oscillospiraceae bacterium]|jgi:hypothetical protein|nr:hypothetical protein [Oscillospiraceae bacterium]
MKKRQIVNIINFIRACEPREEVDLVESVREQLRLMREHALPGTFLLQYDALLREDIVTLLKQEACGDFEYGVWLEIVEPQVRAAGIPWRGRFAWDWHANTGFSVGYTPKERERLIALLFEKFWEIFGYYPKSMGSWIIDAHSLRFASERYGIVASCNCKDQWGTDGYTLWGAYYNQAYYPAKNNAFCPAGTKEGQIGVPVFRMLGSDPIYQYDMGLDVGTGAVKVQGVVTLEPVYAGTTGGGGVPEWVDWYLKENFNEKCLAFSYTQAGQENSFGWRRMKDGLIDQFEKLARLRDAGTVAVEPLCESGRWFQDSFPLTPATTMVTESDWANNGKQSVWYNCRRYRANLLCEGNEFRLRDLYLFDENYRERYLEEVCTSHVLQYDNLPVIDGNRFSGHGVLAGLFAACGGERLHFDGMVYEELSADTAKVTLTNTQIGDFVIVFSPNTLTFFCGADFALLEIHDPQAEGVPACLVEEKNLSFVHRGFPYAVRLSCGRAVQEGWGYRIDSVQGRVVLEF